MVNYYSYKTLIAKCRKNASKANVNALGEWFDRYGQTYWNGEYYSCGLGNLYPIYEEDIENEQLKVVGYELR